MTATYTFDVFSSLDGYGSHSGDWGGYWGKQGPELLDHRLAEYGAEQRMVFGATTYRAFARMLASSTEESEVRDPWVTRMRSLPATVVSTTLEGPLDWPDATVVRGDAVDVVARLKAESEVPLRSHGSLSMNRALMAAGLVDRVQVTLFPVITGQTGRDPIFQGAADFDLELIESRTLDGNRSTTATSKSSSTAPPCMPESIQSQAAVETFRRSGPSNSNARQCSRCRPPSTTPPTCGPEAERRAWRASPRNGSCGRWTPWRSTQPIACWRSAADTAWPYRWSASG